MDMIAYHRSILKELYSLKDRIRNLMDEPHWLTDGEWKESVLRSVLRRHVPSNIEVGRGFIFTPEKCSSQIDILLYDSTCPVVFRDGDLAFVTPDAVRALIEVKSRVSPDNLSDAVKKLVMNRQIINETVLSAPMNSEVFFPCFTGVFAYESDVDDKTALRILKEGADGDLLRVISHMSLGPSSFFRFWESDPYGLPERLKWHSYRLDDLSPAYFISNLISSLSPSSVWLNQATWFPLTSKELRKTDQTFLAMDLD
jgi:hypothetical protein